MTSPTASAIYEGWIRHRRYEPVQNHFRYRLFLLYLDLDELETAFEHSWLWSTRRPAMAWFRRRDHLGPEHLPLDVAVRDLAQQRLGRRPTGSIRLLTHLRYFGLCFNPVSFFYLFDSTDRLDCIVAEVDNTPWGERHWYVLPREAAALDRCWLGFRFAKEFHVSPFLPMEMDYDWRFAVPGETLWVHMSNLDRGRLHFDATLFTRRTALEPASLRRVLARHPAMTLHVLAAIYRQAARLWRKGAPFHEHPGPPPGSVGGPLPKPDPTAADRPDRSHRSA